MRKYFPRAISWVVTHPLALSTPLSAMVASALSHVTGATTHHDFVAGLARGFGANMAEAVRPVFVSDLGRWAGESDLQAPPGRWSASPGNHLVRRAISPLVVDALLCAAMRASTWLSGLTKHHRQCLTLYVPQHLVMQTAYHAPRCQLKCEHQCLLLTCQVGASA